MTDLRPPVWCARCRSPKHVIAGDGPPVCRPCVSRLTVAAADPLNAPASDVAWLADVHADVVRLVDLGHRGLAWRWVAPWPAVRA